ncbi:MAG: RnfABCDGE type electron transport complex subunit B [Oscillospiraceae bacterium]|jgi:Na+-translocating ferredoxin:NAD+ oxidoreductase RNF subunit RnfB|nr:RnfABCDGE type electron transport complex subunit B [Oscillospiraceae bacterium]
MFEVIIPAGILGGLGVVFGAALSFASRVFAVESDPREGEIIEILPGANCGGCGFAGCSNYASSVVAGNAEPNLCVPGGAEVTAKVAAVMSVEATAPERVTAFVRCSGGKRSERQYDYTGLDDCFAALNAIGGGPLTCRFGCLGLGSCTRTCPTGALSLVNGVAFVNRELCTACGQCVKHCPKRLITTVPYAATYRVGCNSHAKGAAVRKLCEAGCIACGICVKACPENAISLDDNLAVIDYAKCSHCGTCAEKCPRKVIEIERA